MQLVSRADGTAPPSCRPVAPLSSSLLFFVSLFTPALVCSCRSLCARRLSICSNFCIALRGGLRKTARWSFRVAFGMGFRIYSPFSSFYKPSRASWTPTERRTDARTHGTKASSVELDLLVAPFFVLWFWGVFFPSFPGPPFHGSRWPTRDTCKWTASGCHGAHFYRRSHGDGLHQDQGAWEGTWEEQNGESVPGLALYLLCCDLAFMCDFMSSGKIRIRSRSGCILSVLGCDLFDVGVALGVLEY